jgi:hypothetical protein
LPTSQAPLAGLDVPGIHPKTRQMKRVSKCGRLQPSVVFSSQTKTEAVETHDLLPTYRLVVLVHCYFSAGIPHTLSESETLRVSLCSQSVVRVQPEIHGNNLETHRVYRESKQCGYKRDSPLYVKKRCV